MGSKNYGKRTWSVSVVTVKARESLMRGFMITMFTMIWEIHVKKNELGLFSVFQRRLIQDAAGPAGLLFQKVIDLFITHFA